MDFFSQADSSQLSPSTGIFGTLNFAQISESVTKIAETATNVATQGVETMTVVFDEPSPNITGQRSTPQTSEDIEAQETYEAERLRLKERELRRREEVQIGANKMRGKAAKQNALEMAKAKAAAEKKAREEKVAQERATAAERGRRFEENEAFYAARLEAMERESKSMEAEETAMREFLVAEEEFRLRELERLELEKEEAKRQANLAAEEARKEAERVAEAARQIAVQEENERVAMEAEEWRAIQVLRQEAELAAALEAERVAEVAKQAAFDWDELVALLKPHGLGDAAALEALRSCDAVSTRKVLAHETDLSRLRAAGFNKMKSSKLLSVCKADVQKEIEDAAKDNKPVEALIANRRKKSQAHSSGASTASSAPTTTGAPAVEETLLRAFDKVSGKNKTKDAKLAAFLEAQSLMSVEDLRALDDASGEQLVAAAAKDLALKPIPLAKFKEVVFGPLGVAGKGRNSSSGREGNTDDSNSPPGPSTGTAI